ncbi:hypothetical protein [Pseudoduganella sp.]|uniref:hypothetical protein n=1 Tax=Pseudoduganella sp. TaxID=1880898 RepID=UPI0035B07824
MNKYLDLVEDILERTYKGSLHWQQVANDKHAQQISEPWNVIRQFEATFPFNGEPATLLCVEKRVYIYEYLFPHEDRMCELLILSGGEIIKTVGAPFLPWYWLSKFGDIIAKVCEVPAVPKLA